MYLIRIVNGLLMFAIPLTLAFYVTNKFKMGWGLWWIGGAIFIISQIGHIPFNYLASMILNKTNLVNWSRTNQIIFNACFLGLSAGLWEEGSRYAMYHWWIKESKSWQKGILLGVGHGGFESMLLGILALYTFVQMVTVKNIDISTIVPHDQLTYAIQSITTYWSQPWYESLLGSIERGLTLPIQIAFSIIVLQVFLRNQIRWLWIAFLFHAIVDTTAVLIISYSSLYIAELVVASFTLLSIWIIFRLRSPDGEEQTYPIKTSLKKEIVTVKDIDETRENLDATIYR